MPRGAAIQRERLQQVIESLPRDQASDVCDREPFVGRVQRVGRHPGAELRNDGDRQGRDLTAHQLGTRFAARDETLEAAQGAAPAPALEGGEPRVDILMSEEYGRGVEGTGRPVVPARAPPGGGVL